MHSSQPDTERERAHRSLIAQSLLQRLFITFRHQVGRNNLVDLPKQKCDSQRLLPFTFRSFHFQSNNAARSSLNIHDYFSFIDVMIFSMPEPYSVLFSSAGIHFPLQARRLSFNGNTITHISRRPVFW